MNKFNALTLAWRSFVDSNIPSWKGTLLKTLLAPFSFLYILWISIKNRAYDWHIFPSFKPKTLTVISIGNLSLGGTGKTPLTMLIANILEKAGNGAVLTRGYGRKGNGSLVIHQDNYTQYHPRETGDEPYLIAKNTKALVIVDKHREKSLKEAAFRGCTWALLDDGFQRRKTRRDIDILVMGPTFLGNGWCLPVGPLREPPSALKRADLIVMIGKQEEQENTLRLYTKAPIIEAEWRFLSLSSELGSPLTQKGEKIGVFCGIGNPLLFIETVKEAGFLVEKTLFIQDHAVPGEKELSSFWRHCHAKGCTKLLCTEKDYVKLDEKSKSTLPIYYVESCLHIVHGEDILRRLINKPLAYGGDEGNG